MKRQQRLSRAAGISRGLFGSALGLAMLALLLVPLGAAAQTEDTTEGFIIGVGMAFDPAEDVPAEIAFLYEDLNADILSAGDQILEYRGFPVSSGADLYHIVLALPDVAPGEVVNMLIAKATGEVVAVQPVAAALETKKTDTTFPDRQCEEEKGNCLCKKPKLGSTCVRTIHTEVDANGKVVSTSSSCVDGVNICPPPPPKPKKKGK